MKQTQTQYFLLDIMLCAVGCLLMVLLASLVQKRAPGSHQKPLSLFSKASGTDKAFQKVEWRLQRPDSSLVELNHERGILISPNSRYTMSGENCCHFIRQAMEGTWILECSLIGGRAEAAKHSEFANQLSVALIKSDQTQLLSRYKETFRKSQGLVNPTAEEIEQISLEIQSQEDTIVNRYGTANVAAINPSLDLFLHYRSCVRRLELLSLRSERTDAEEKKAESLEQEIKQLLVQASGDNNVKNKILLEGLALEEKLRNDRAMRDTTGSSTPEYALAKLAEWNGKGENEEFYYEYMKNVLLGWRAILNYVARPKVNFDNAALDRIADAIGYMSNDLLSGFLLEEIKVSMKPDTSIVLSMSIAWGDLEWPNGDVGNQSTIRVLLPSNGRFRPIARISLEDGEPLSVAWLVVE